MKINNRELKEICETPGAPGFEELIRSKIVDLIKSSVDDYYTDNMGNLITVKKSKNSPNKKKIMVAAHMDEIGFIVTHITKDGFLKFHTLGGFDPKTLTAQRVIVHGKKDLIGVMGTKPIHVMSPEEQKKIPKSSDYFIDLGMKKKEVEKYIEIGNPVTREREFIEMGDCVNCKSIDNRISVYILIEILRKIKNPPYDVYGVFTVQEEMGMRGANVATHLINPDFALALDTTIAFDVPGAQEHEKVTSLGEGAAIKIMDASVICDSRMVEFLKSTAAENSITWQPEILTAGGTDTAMMQKTGKNGAISGAVSIPTRHIHQVIEMAHKEDVISCIDLLCVAIQNIDQWKWDHKS
jgi:endoglucanase